MTFQTFTGKEYLKIDVANNFGLDKKDWDERIAWFDENQDNLEELQSQAKEPALYYAGVKAFRDVEAGKPIGYPIGLDACSSGLQLLSVLIGCRKSAQLCGVLDTGHRENAYQTLYDKMCEINDSDNVIDMDDVKKAIMTALYGSEAVPERVFGTGNLLQIFEHVMETEAEGAWKLNKAMIDLWNPNALSNDWILPDNFHVKVKVIGKREETIHFLNKPYTVELHEVMPRKKGKSLAPNIIHSIDALIVREIVRRCNYDPAMIGDCVTHFESKNISRDRKKDKMVDTLWNNYLNSGFLSARILDYLDYQNMGNVDAKRIMELIDTFPKKPFEIITVHDCFRVLPNYGNDIRRMYNQMLHEIANSNLLSFIVSQVRGEHTTTFKFGSFGNDILEANYALS